MFRVRFHCQDSWFFGWLAKSKNGFPMMVEDSRDAFVFDDEDEAIAISRTLYDASVEGVD